MKYTPSPLQVWRAEYALLSRSIRALKNTVQSSQVAASTAYNGTLPPAVQALADSGEISDAQVLRIRSRLARNAFASSKGVVGALTYQKGLARSAMANRKVLAEETAARWEQRNKDRSWAKHNQRGAQKD